MSMKPGATTWPRASIVRRAARPELGSTATIRPASTITSASRPAAPVPSTTRPLRIASSSIAESLRGLVVGSGLARAADAGLDVADDVAVDGDVDVLVLRVPVRDG